MGFLDPRANRRRAVAAVAATALDVALFQWLKKDDRPFRLAPRLALDALEIAAWGAMEDQVLDPVVHIGTPLAGGAGGRLGAPPVVVPVVNALATLGVRRALGRRTRLFPFAWQLAGNAAGVAVVGYERRRGERIERRQRAEADAGWQQSFLAGEHSVAMAADSVVDL